MCLNLFDLFYITCSVVREGDTKLSDEGPSGEILLKA